jgi:predicted DNA-binding transcriptional regulator AlpA
MALVGIKEVAEMIGVSRTRADQLSRRPSFPEPKVRHVRVRMWEASDVEAWLDRYRPGWRGDEAPERREPESTDEQDM